MFYLSLSDSISILALLLSGYAIKKTVDFNERQKEFIETNDKLNKLLLEKESQDALQQRKADISANFIKVANNDYRLKVFNKGKNTAKNIRIEFPEGNELLIKSDINRKFPVPILEQHQSVELLSTSSLGSPNRLTIKLIWDDEYGTDNEKILTPTK